MTNFLYTKNLIEERASQYKPREYKELKKKLKEWEMIANNVDGPSRWNSEADNISKNEIIKADLLSDEPWDADY